MHDCFHVKYYNSLQHYLCAPAAVSLLHGNALTNIKNHGLLLKCFFFSTYAAPSHRGQWGNPPQQSGQEYGYFPVTQYPLQSQNSTNVVVVQGGPSVQQTTIIEQRERVNHCLHCIISVFCFPWILIWCCLCCIYGC